MEKKILIVEDEFIVANDLRMILEKADFSTAYNYVIDPELNTIRKAKFSIAGITGLLHKYDIDIV